MNHVRYESIEIELPRPGVRIPDCFISQAKSFLNCVLERIDQKFLKNGGRTYLERASILQLPAILYVADGDLCGKKILDLAAGACPSNVLEPHGGIPDPKYEPWLCRLLFYMDVDVIGLDIGNLRDEPFKSYSGIDLSEKDSPAMIPDNFIDIAHLSTLLSGHYVIKGSNGISTHPTMENQLERIVKPKGTYLWCSN